MDIRTLNPFDETPLLGSVRKTGRLIVADTGWRSVGFAAEIVTRVVEQCFGDLKEPPVRITLPDLPTPTTRALSNYYYPLARDIAAAARRLASRPLSPSRRSGPRTFSTCRTPLLLDRFDYLGLDPRLLMTAPVRQPADHAAPLPTFSVVVPNYNHAHYLEAALHAHLSQSVPPLEIIVVDDASTDESVAIVERLATAHSRLRLIRLAKNGGVNAAINRGLHEARGDYVCVSAADDLVASSLAARSLEILARHPTAGLCSSDAAVMVGDTGTVQQIPLFLSDRPCLLLPGDIVRLLTHDLVSFPSYTVLYRRDALLALGGFIEDLRWWADSFANYVLAFRHGACYVPEVLGCFRLLPDSYSARGARNTRAQRELLYRILDLLQTPAFHDVAQAFRASAIVTPERLRVLGWLLASPRHRGYLTPRLGARLLFYGLRSVLWSVVRPYTPDWLRQAARRAARRFAGRQTRRMLASRRARMTTHREEG